MGIPFHLGAIILSIEGKMINITRKEFGMIEGV